MDQDKRAIFILAAHTLRFATEHPYAATGICGAIVGSAVTYRVMKYEAVNEAASRVFNPRVYECAVPEEDLRRMLADPNYELRWEMSDASVVVTAEKRDPPIAVLDVEYKEL